MSNVLIGNNMKNVEEDANQAVCSANEQMLA